MGGGGRWRATDAERAIGWKDSQGRWGLVTNIPKRKLYTGCPRKSGMADFSVHCELKALYISTSLDKAYSAEENDT